MNHWIVTLPRTIEWHDYEKELATAMDGETVLNYRTRYIPRDMEVGDRMYITWRNMVQGWMRIVSFGQRQAFVCETTGQTWPEGNYIQRSGAFYYIDPTPFKGFRGIRRYQP
jgi:predicted RNA-binding protein with PUA-like domain